jgi:hypothetical protein
MGDTVVTDNILDPSAFRAPAISLAGAADYAMYQLSRSIKPNTQKGLVVTELSTLGGDPEVARMIGEDVRYHSDLERDRHFVFLGKAAIYSARVSQAKLKRRRLGEKSPNGPSHVPP